MSSQFTVEKTQHPKTKPDQQNLGFGKHFTDHMFLMNYTAGEGWHDARIVPYAPLSLDPAAMVFHYGQAVFEGLKAYKTEGGRVLLFRPDQNLERLNISNERLSIPQIDEALVLEGIKELVRTDADWIPTAEGTSLYIRPFIIATDAALGVHPSPQYLLIVILSPVGAYYPEGLKPVKINVESEYVRAVRGGTGVAKTAGNYAASLRAQEEAEKQGYAQVLWLDGVEKKYIEEVGSMNVFFKINGEVVTPALNGSILSGVTRRSIIQILQDKEIPVVERRISIEELYEASVNGTLEEAFGTGTAAVISPIGELNWEDKQITINKGEIGQVSQELYDTLTGIQNGKVKDTFGWTFEV
ncbi:branched chain amino acid aminotransferase [Aneurinibacillus soli]|uniref:Branched-chain-amino-acid aminotransferase n=1 Tax=Aneurinibacillus soli TaxID=1500254 RepID=A0A0U5AX71_9BACL|nr:branched-chain amino acid aminotransferase [Aneurinibacillus soli]PYE64381.1 branched chain amino acid aminotransferase [Aneurinibacillus soli]BAU28330.1 Branched-chain-amino-acid aminotransferase 2 [Aneurinibacillus soli]